MELIISFKQPGHGRPRQREKGGRADHLCVDLQPPCLNTSLMLTLERLSGLPTILRIKSKVLTDALKTPRGLASLVNPILNPHTIFPASYTPGSQPPRSSRTCKEPSCQLACVAPFLICFSLLPFLPSFLLSFPSFTFFISFLQQIFTENFSFPDRDAKGFRMSKVSNAVLVYLTI